MINEWAKPDHALDYLRRLEEIPHRTEGEATLISEVPKGATRILDLGCGNGHLLALLLAHCDNATGVGLDFSPTMLSEATRRFANDTRVDLVMHNLDSPLPALGAFNVIASSFAIHGAGTGWPSSAMAIDITHSRISQRIWRGRRF